MPRYGINPPDPNAQSAGPKDDLGWLGPLLGGGAGIYGLTQANQMSNPGLNQEQQNLVNAGNQTYQTALDPRHELYGRTAQQLQDQVRASDSARGVAMSPFSAGVENKAMSDFNIDWQNAQLGRQVSGVGAMAGANQAATGIGQLGLQNRQFGAGQTGANTNAFLTALSQLTGGGTGAGGAGAGGGTNYIQQLMRFLSGGGSGMPANMGADQFGNPTGGSNFAGGPGTPGAGDFYTFDNSGSGMPVGGGGFDDFGGGWGGGAPNYLPDLGAAF